MTTMPTLKIDGPRACTPAEVPEVIALVDAALGRHGTGQSLLTDYPLVYEEQNLANVRILKVDGELASVVPFVVWPVEGEGYRFTMAMISPTATAEVFRKRGYGRLCLEDCHRRMEAIGCELAILRTKVETFPFYESGEYQGVQSQAWLYRCTRADAKCFLSSGDDIQQPGALGPGQLGAIQAMHEREEVGTRRSRQRYAALFSLPRMKTLLAYRHGRPVAYLVVSRAINMPGLLEAGGDPAGVATLVHRALADWGETEVCLAHTDLTASVLGEVLDRGLPGRRQPTGENRMVRINQPKPFLEAIAPGRRPGAIETLRGLSRHQLVSAVFGAHPSYSPPPASGPTDSAPFYFPVSILNRS